MQKDRKLTSEDIACRRCGACCEKGGPALHRQDHHLIESGRLPLKNLFTIRPGETVRDNVKGNLIRTSTDIIKIKGRGKSWCCLFFDKKNKACTLYDDRPLECRVLNCRNPEALESIYDKDRLTRKDLLSNMTELWNLVEDHEHRCSLDRVSKLLNPKEGTLDMDEREQLAFILNYDLQVRKLLIEKGKMDPEILDFLFGRPVEQIIHTSSGKRN